MLAGARKSSRVSRNVTFKGPKLQSMFVEESNLRNRTPPRYSMIENFKNLSFPDFCNIVSPHEKEQNELWFEEWTDHGIFFPPKAMLTMEDKKPSSPLSELKKLLGTNDYTVIETFLLNVQTLLGLYHSPERHELISLLTDLFQCSQRNAVRKINILCDKVFRTTVPIKRHKEYGDAVVVVDYSEGFAKDFFFNKRYRDEQTTHGTCKNRLALYAKLLEEGGSDVVTSMNNHNMRFIFDTEARRNHSRTLGGNEQIKWPCPDYLWEAFEELNRSILVKLGMDESMKLNLLDDIGFLYTVNETPQRPHFDFKNQAVLNLLGMQHDVDTLSDFPTIERGNLPYSMDMPLTTNGLRLQIFGLGNGSKFYSKVPFPLRVEFQSAVFWRADVIHGGNLRGLDFGGAFRMHTYIPFSLQQAFMAKTHKPEIQWHWWSGEHMSQFFRDVLR